MNQQVRRNLISIGGLVLLVAMALGSIDQDKKTASTNSSSPAPESAEKQGSEDADANLPVKVLGSHTNRYKMVNKYVLVKKGLNDDELISLAKELHKTEPTVTFWLLDDDSKADDLLASLKEVEKGNQEAFPTEWAKEHIVANVQEFFGGEKGRYWAVSKGMWMDKIAALE